MTGTWVGLVSTALVVGITSMVGGQTTRPAAAGATQAIGHEQDREILSFGDILKRDIKELPRSLWEDTKITYTSPVNIGVLLLAGGASLAVRNTDVDDKWEHHFDKHRSFSVGWGDTAGVIGNPGTHLALAAAAYAYGVHTRETNDKTYEMSKALMNALLITDVSTVLLKTAACQTESPNGEDWAWPSGHTSSSFAMAAVLDKYYGHWVGVPAYGVAGLVGFERMDDREHYFSDVVFGAALGAVIGYSVANNHYPRLLGGDIVPYVDPIDGKTGVAWIKEF